MSKLLDYVLSLAKTSKEGGISHTQKAVDKLKEKIEFVKQVVGQNCKDDKIWMAQTEERLLGISHSAKKIDSYDLSMVENKCKDFFTARPNQRLVIGVDILEVFEGVTFSGPS